MNYETKTLNSKRLVIKKGDKKDFLSVYEYDFKKLKNIDGVFLYVKKDLKEFDNLFKGGKDKYYNRLKKAHMFDWIIYLKDEPIGNILTNYEDEKEVEIKCNMHPLYWNKGYMKEALKEVIKYLFEIGYEKILFGYEDGNKKAKCLSETLGFKPYKILKDEYTTEKNNKVDIYMTVKEKKS